MNTREFELLKKCLKPGFEWANKSLSVNHWLFWHLFLKPKIKLPHFSYVFGTRLAFFLYASLKPVILRDDVHRHLNWSMIFVYATKWVWGYQVYWKCWVSGLCLRLRLVPHSNKILSRNPRQAFWSTNQTCWWYRF